MLQPASIDCTQVTNTNPVTLILLPDCNTAVWPLVASYVRHQTREHNCKQCCLYGCDSCAVCVCDTSQYVVPPPRKHNAHTHSDPVLVSDSCVRLNQHARLSMTQYRMVAVWSTHRCTHLDVENVSVANIFVCVSWRRHL